MNYCAGVVIAGEFWGKKTLILLSKFKFQLLFYCRRVRAKKLSHFWSNSYIFDFGILVSPLISCFSFPNWCSSSLTIPPSTNFKRCYWKTFLFSTATCGNWFYFPNWEVGLQMIPCRHIHTCVHTLSFPAGRRQSAFSNTKLVLQPTSMASIQAITDSGRFKETRFQIAF